MKNILMVIAPVNFRDTEYITPRAFFEQNNAKVMTTSSVKKSRGRFGFEVENDFLLSEVNPAKFSGIFLVGGGGSLDFMDNKELKDLVSDFISSKKAVGAICAAPRLLLNWGFLKNKSFTGWNGDSVLEKMGQENLAKFSGKAVEIDGNILTADGPTSVEEAALNFLEIL